MSDEPAPGVTTEMATCQRPDCGNVFPQNSGRGRKRRYCSPACRRMMFDANNAAEGRGPGAGQDIPAGDLPDQLRATVAALTRISAGLLREHRELSPASVRARLATAEETAAAARSERDHLNTQLEAAREAAEEAEEAQAEAEERAEEIRAEAERRAEEEAAAAAERLAEEVELRELAEQRAATLAEHLRTRDGELETARTTIAEVRGHLTEAEGRAGRLALLCEQLQGERDTAVRERGEAHDEAVTAKAEKEAAEQQRDDWKTERNAAVEQARIQSEERGKALEAARTANREAAEAVAARKALEKDLTTARKDVGRLTDELQRLREALGAEKVAHARTRESAEAAVREQFTAAETAVLTAAAPFLDDPDQGAHLGGKAVKLLQSLRQAVITRDADTLPGARGYVAQLAGHSPALPDNRLSGRLQAALDVYAAQLTAAEKRAHDEEVPAARRP